MINLLKQYRTQANMTQQRLAAMVNVSSRTIISLETGRYNPSLLLAYRIARVFGTSVEEIFCLNENMRLEDEQNEKL